MYWASTVMRELNANSMIVASVRHAKAVTVPSAWVAKTFQRDMRFSPHVIGHAIEYAEWADHDRENEGYVLWNKNRPTDVCDPAPVAWLAERFTNTAFISTFIPPGPILTNLKSIGVVPYERMHSYVQSAAVYLATTKETFGIGILEAMASGVPVLAVARGNAPELIEHEVTGYLGRNWEDMAAGLAFCLANRDRLGAAAREAARAYTWERVCEQVADVYREALVDELPTVAIVIPSFNYADQVGRAIESATKQTYPHLTNIVVVDDGSDDDGATERVVTAWGEKDKRVHYLRQDNMGVAHARNNGIASVDTKYACCLDADDALAPRFLEACVDELERDRSLGLAYTGLYYIKPHGEEGTSPWPGEYDFDEFLKRKNQVPTCCMFRREMWKRLGGYRQRYAPQGAGSEDAEFWLRCGAAGWGGKKATQEAFFIYSWMSGRVSGDPNYHEADWLGWHPWVHDGQHPFASCATPANKRSHPVHQYDEPKVGVVIPVGPGHQGMLVDALDSLEAQTYRDWEVVVVNDTGHELDLTAYPYVKLIETEGKRGAGYARNRGIEALHTKLFVCLDADDFLQPAFLQEVLDEFEANPGAWIYTDLFILHADGSLENYACEDWDVEQLWRSGVCSVTCLYTLSMWNKVGGFDEDHNREDWDFHLRLAKAGYCGIRLQHPLLTYRHATGKRRDEGSIKEEVRRLRERYPLEELQMACTDCGKSRRSKMSDQSPPGSWASKEDLGWPMLEYVGNNKNTLVFKGRTGRLYRFGRNQYDRFGRVHPDDVRHLLGFVYFREAVAPTPGPEVPLQAQPTPPPPPQPEPQSVADFPIELPPPPAIDVADFTVARLREESRNGALSIADLEKLLAQEETKKRPRGTAVAIMKRSIRQRQAAMEA
jgi:glycosyltransferase involved in cell wall biosynthesis